MEASIVIPTLNEYENLRVLLPQLFTPDWEIIVCDNGSTDGTVRLVEDAAANFNVRLSKGTGTVTDAILRGLREARSGKIIVMDGDGSHSPDVVYRLVSALDESDMVVGSRYIKGGRSKDSFKNKVISRGFNLLTYPLVPGIKDRASGFWGIRKSLVKTPIRNTVKPMLEYLVRGNPVSVLEVPYTFQPRLGGEPKLGKPIFKTLVDLVFLYFQKFNRFIKFCCVGGIGTLVCLGVTYLFTEVAGFWYMLSVAVGALAAAVWNFTGHKFVTYAKEGAHLDPDYEWNAWYRGNPLQKWWKRRIGYLTREFLGSPSTLLDVGCGSSPVLNLFHCKRFGIDRSKEKLDFLGKYTTAKLYPIDVEARRIPFSDSSLNGVICNNVLEHLKGPSKVVEGISRVLKEGGRAVITIPDEESFIGRIGDWLYRKFGSYGHEHIIKLTSKGLDRVCGSVGLKLVGSRRILSDTMRCYQKG